MNNDPRYEDLNSINFPKLGLAQADKVSRAIIRSLGAKKYGSENQIAPARWPRGVRRCWLSSKPTTGHHKGWGRMIHDLSHAIFRARHPSFRPHDGGHSAMEREVLLFCQQKGYLDGRGEPKPKRKLTREEVLRLEAISLQKRYARWQTKARRAATAMSNLARRQRYVNQQLEKIGTAPVGEAE